jgi:dTDP-4-amino-4,6-dideoxygalactose transaminase
MIPFNKPVWLGSEAQRVHEAIAVNGHLAGGGPFGKRCEELLEPVIGRRALLVGSCTHALEMSAILLAIGPGDEVILPSFTFVSTANAFALRGARLRFADVDAHGNIDPGNVAGLLGRRTRAVVAVHYGGHSCDLDALAEVRRDVPLVEDAAQALGARFRDRPLGSFGACSAFSFHETKNVGCGEGGALTVCNDSLLERAEYLRDKGTNRRKFLSGLVDKYTWVDIGSSYVLSDLNAAYLHDQLVARERIQSRRREVHERYRAALAPAVERSGAYLVHGRPENTENQHLFAIVFRRSSQRDAYIAHMRAHEIVTPFHYVALHLSPMGRQHADERPLPMAERLTTNLVRLPLFFNISDAEVEQVIDRTLEFLDAL